MKIYAIINAITGKCNMPFVCESEADAREFCLKNVLSDNTGSLLSISKYLFCHEIGSFELGERDFECSANSAEDIYFVTKRNFVDFAEASSALSAFCVYDVVAPLIEEAEKNKLKKECDADAENHT